jgi:hypothetical protein
MISPDYSLSSVFPVLDAAEQPRLVTRHLPLDLARGPEVAGQGGLAEGSPVACDLSLVTRHLPLFLGREIHAAARVT